MSQSNKEILPHTNTQEAFFSLLATLFPCQQLIVPITSIFFYIHCFMCFTFNIVVSEWLFRNAI